MLGIYWRFSLSQVSKPCSGVWPAMPYQHNQTPKPDSNTGRSSRAGQLGASHWSLSSLFSHEGRQFCRTKTGAHVIISKIAQSELGTVYAAHAVAPARSRVDSPHAALQVSYSLLRIMLVVNCTTQPASVKSMQQVSFIRYWDRYIQVRHLLDIETIADHTPLAAPLHILLQLTIMT